ncbi:MAG: 3-deoxy-7-phosphoheptulonate synthase [Gammaproteobacteria bacterium]|nr:3-deoxy-7-phosphoheptulonate synthase [Gammaproteobacteria bacterium]
MSDAIDNVNVLSLTNLPPPAAVKAELALDRAAATTVLGSRRALQDIIDGRDPRLLVVVGPCSIHDVGAALEYAGRLKALAAEVADALCLVMRVYFEKPRTTVGWKGLINDPDMDDSCDMEKGIRTARRLLLDLTAMGLPTATEALDPVMPQYLGDLISWTAIGARTTESQTHREMASGLSTPVGFKNGTDGGLQVAINALKSARQPHRFLGINQDGRPAVIHTRGNAYGHVVLRGGGGRPNYDSVCVALCEKALREAGLPARIVVDCSHGNSNKDPALQPLVAKDCIEQVVHGNRAIIGLMLESNLGWGNQDIPADRTQLQFGVSVTDACIDWAATETTLREAAGALRPVLARTAATAPRRAGQG